MAPTSASTCEAGHSLSNMQKGGLVRDCRRVPRPQTGKLGLGFRSLGLGLRVWGLYKKLRPRNLKMRGSRAGSFAARSRLLCPPEHSASDSLLPPGGSNAKPFLLLMPNYFCAWGRTLGLWDISYFSLIGFKRIMSRIFFRGFSRGHPRFQAPTQRRYSSQALDPKPYT